MHICQSISQIYSPRNGVIAGGNINAMLGLSRGLVEAGHEVSVIAGWPHDHAPDLVRAEVDPVKLELFPIRSRGPVMRNVELFTRAWLKTRAWGKDHKFDLVHGHSGYAQLAALTVALKSNLRVRCVHTLYIPFTDRVNDARSPLLGLQAPVRRTLAAIEQLVAISENVRESVQQAGISPDAVRVVPPAVRQAREIRAKERRAQREELGVTSDDVMMLFVGNFTWAKGFDLVVRAFAGVADEMSNAKLVYTCETGPKHHEERAAEIEALLSALVPPAKRVRLGIVRDIPRLLAAADVFVLPFRETAGPMDYPMALLEAMAAGTAVVTTRVGGIPEVVRDGVTGYLVPPGDPTALAKGIVRLLSDEKKRKLMGRRAREETVARFGVDAVANVMEDVYRSVVNKR